ncbi:NosD domain-containing protein [Ekhidna sp.]
MKKITMICAGIICAFLSTAQTTRIANNNPGATGGTNVYTGTDALQDAIDAAVSGDIIHVVPSAEDYNDGMIDGKSLTIIGIGLDPTSDIGLRSLVDEIRLDNTGASGSRISGLHVSRVSMAISTTFAHTVSNVLIENCLIDRIHGAGFAVGSPNSISGIIIRNCIINSSNSTGDAQGFELYNSSGVVIENNIIKGRCCVAGSVQGVGMTIQHNLFFNGSNGISFHNIDDCIVRNNIFLNSTPGIGTGQTGNTFTNNLSYNTTNDVFLDGVDGNTASGNLEGVNPMLTDVPQSTSDWNFSNDITPITGSPVLGAATDGTDIGPTGGAVPFNIEGSFLPLIESLSVPTVVSQGVDLQVTIKARGNITND